MYILTSENFLSTNETIDTATAYVVKLSAKSFENELTTNLIKFKKTRPTVFLVEPSAKARLAIRLTKERFGSSSVIVESNK